MVRKSAAVVPGKRRAAGQPLPAAAQSTPVHFGGGSASSDPSPIAPPDTMRKEYFHEG
jgi:hypothetical protein